MYTISDIRKKWEPVFAADNLMLKIEKEKNPLDIEGCSVVSVNNFTNDLANPLPWHKYPEKSLYTFITSDRSLSLEIKNPVPAEKAADDIRQLITFLSIEEPQDEPKRSRYLRDIKDLGYRIQRFYLGRTGNIENFDRWLKDQLAPGFHAGIKNWEMSTLFEDASSNYILGSESLAKFSKVLDAWLAEPDRYRESCRLSAITAVAHLDAFAELCHKTQAGAEIYINKMRKIFKQEFGTEHAFCPCLLTSTNRRLSPEDTPQTLIFMTENQFKNAVNTYGYQNINKVFDLMVSEKIAIMNDDVWKVTISTENGQENIGHAYGMEFLEKYLAGFNDGFKLGYFGDRDEESEGLKM